MPDDAFEKRYARLVTPTYVLALLLLILPFIDYGASIWPIQASAVSWRYGAAGLLGGFLLTPLLGLLMLAALGVLLDSKSVLGLTGAGCLLLGALLLVADVSFVLDSVQMRGTIPKEQIRVFDAGVVKAILKHLTGALFAWMLAFSCFRARGALGKRDSRDAQAGSLVVGGAPGKQAGRA